MSCSCDNTIKVWNYETYELKQTLIGHSDYVISLEYIQEAKLILSGSRDDTIKIWNYDI